MIRRLHYALLCLALGSQILFGIAGSSFVLCTEADGELALEWGLAGWCCDTSSTALTTAGESWTSMEDCGACADGALDLSLRSRDGRPVHVLEFSPLFVSRQPIGASSPMTAQAPRPPPGLASLKTVALRC